MRPGRGISPVIDTILAFTLRGGPNKGAKGDIQLVPYLLSKLSASLKGGGGTNKRRPRPKAFLLRKKGGDRFKRRATTGEGGGSARGSAVNLPEGDHRSRVRRGSRTRRGG